MNDLSELRYFSDRAAMLWLFFEGGKRFQETAVTRFAAHAVWVMFQ